MHNFRCLLLLGLLAAGRWTPCAAAPEVFILGDMEKPDGAARVASNPDYLSSEGTITLAGARNETIAFQVLLRAGHDETMLDLRVGDLTGPGRIPADPNISLFLEHYITTEDASYSWGPRGGAGALPWKGRWWPDALIPFTDPYDPAHPPVAAPFDILTRRHPNQGIWIDVTIPKETPPGTYRGQLDVMQHDQTIRSFPLRLEVWPITLPDENHVDAFGELYGDTGIMFDSGTSFKKDPDAEWAIYRRYLQMAHAHRFLATERQHVGPAPAPLPGRTLDDPGRDWSGYTPYVGPVLEGSLFTPEQGYTGPGQGTPPAFYPAPFSEITYKMDSILEAMRANDGQVPPELLRRIERTAADFWAEAGREGWRGVRFFAYIFDEVDSNKDTGESGSAPATADHSTLAHQAMQQVQAALDRGTGGPQIALIWTSHADAARWVGTAADLRPTIRWWAPNGDAVNLDFYPALARTPGQRVWFYHSGQPSVGNVSINQLGIDLRLWGLLCRRYGLHGSFWWSMMCFAEPAGAPGYNPFADPVYKHGDTRWGNGVLFYPGARLTQAGARRNIAGPVGSMRMKAYRRGLQDYEYCWLADQQGHRDAVDALLSTLIPAAFSAAPDAAVPGRWSHNPADYDALRRQLAALLME